MGDAREIAERIVVQDAYTSDLALADAIEAALLAERERSEKRGREQLAAELLNHLDRAQGTTAAYHLIKSLCLVEVGKEPNTLGVELD